MSYDQRIKDAAGGEVRLLEDFGRIMGSGFKRLRDGKIVRIRETLRKVVVRINEGKVYSAFPME